MIIASDAFASAGDTLQVKVKDFPPCVVVQGDGTVTGFDIDIWNAVGREVGFTSDYQVELFHDNILNELKHKRTDVGIAGFTITESREEYVDFSHHYLDSGLRILTLKQEVGMFDKAKIFWESTKGLFTFYGIFLILFAHLVWGLERDNDDTNNDGSFNDKYFPGIFEAIYYCVITASTVGYGDLTCKKWRGRFLSLVLVITAIPAFCNFTAVLSSSYTTQSMASIQSVEDLKGKTILTQDGPSLKVLENIGANVKVVPTIDQAVDWLMLERGDAVVYDSPIILEYAKKYPDKVEAVGYLFDKQYYGFALQEGSSLRQDVNKALLKIRESGEYDSIHSKWFKKD